MAFPFLTFLPKLDLKDVWQFSFEHWRWINSANLIQLKAPPYWRQATTGTVRSLFSTYRYFQEALPLTLSYVVTTLSVVVTDVAIAFGIWIKLQDCLVNRVYRLCIGFICIYQTLPLACPSATPAWIIILAQPSPQAKAILPQVG